MRRFNFLMDEPLYGDFYRMFPDKGTRTALLRHCVRGLVKRAKIFGGVLPSDAEDIGKFVHEEVSRLKERKE